MPFKIFNFLSNINFVSFPTKYKWTQNAKPKSDQLQVVLQSGRCGKSPWNLSKSKRLCYWGVQIVQERTAECHSLMG